MKATYVIGHKNPDTDSVCSAICYAFLKHRLTGEEYIPCRAGEINGETAFVLEHFHVAAPQLLTSLEPTIADVQFRSVEGISSTLSLKRAWEHMRDHNIQTVPILTKRRKIKGLLTLGDQARYYMEDQDPSSLAKAKPKYSSIADTIHGEVVVGDPEAQFSKGKVVVAAANPDLMEEYIAANDMVIMGNRYDSQFSAIEMDAGCIIVCLGAKVTKTISKLASEKGCTVIETPLDTFSVAKLINQSIPVSHIMRKDDIISFGLDDTVADVRATVSKLRVRYFPITDSDGRYVGLMSQRNLLDIERRRVILVDHNEKGQAVDGIRSAQVVEVIDHHRIDSVETMNPIYFRNQPLGCTATIITQMFRENNIEIEPTIAGLLCSAIISDTLMFRSPTCTDIDRSAAEMLADKAEIDIKKYARAMFNAGSRLGKKTPEEIYNLDCKPFEVDKTKLTIAQVTSVSGKELSKVKERMLPYMEELLPTSGRDMLFLMLTDIFDESTELLFVGQGAKGVVQTAFEFECTDNSVVLPGVVSRKKQVVVPIIETIEML